MEEEKLDEKFEEKEYNLINDWKFVSIVHFGN
jgi:hypothetical protein